TRAQVEGGLIWAQSEGQVAHFWVYLVCGLLAWLGLPLLFAAWRMFRTSRHRYELTDQRLAEQRGVFLRDTEQLELFRVRDISVVEPI
ncbi:PH domain-containing protein, partial [Klebsiella aerogenes]